MNSYVPTWFHTNSYLSCKVNPAKEHIVMSATATHVHMCTLYTCNVLMFVHTGTHMLYHAGIRSMFEVFGSLLLTLCEWAKAYKTNQALAFLFSFQNVTKYAYAMIFNENNSNKMF